MSDRVISFESGVNVEGKPFIHLRWGKEMAQLTPEQAIRHALGVIETAQGALTDAFLVTFLRDRLGTPIEKGAVLLKDFREYREARVSTLTPDELAATAREHYEPPAEPKSH